MAKIYHYTTIDTLALIMLNKTIRFNRLDLVDDKEETLYSSGPYDTKICKNVFVSCWTRDPIENHDLWKRYTKGYRGVRIALDEDMFITYEINDHFISYFREWNTIIEDCVFPLPLNEAKLNDVRYVYNNEHYIKNAIRNDGNYIHISIQELGLYKRKNKWEQQAESRFKLFCYPTTPEILKIIQSNNINVKLSAWEDINSLLFSNHQINLEYYDMPLKKDALDSIEVMMGPATSDDDRDKVKRILFPCPISRIISKRKIINSKILTVTTN